MRYHNHPSCRHNALVVSYRIVGSNKQTPRAKKTPYEVWGSTMIPLCHTFGVGLGARYNSNKMKIEIRTIVKKKMHYWT